ncbi:MAG: DUF2890 domain-containing protein [Phycisphaera sp.]|nr:DUF2890 domain-containing protein [Phycisphaera sp.]
MAQIQLPDTKHQALPSLPSSSTCCPRHPPHLTVRRLSRSWATLTRARPRSSTR